LSNLPPSYQDLRASENGNPFGRLWNRLLERLDAQRIVLRPGLTEEHAGNCRTIGITNANGNLSSQEIFWGTPIVDVDGAFNNIRLHPCNIHGTELVADSSRDLNVYVNADQSVLDIGSRVLSTSAIVAYCYAGSTAYVLGAPQLVVVSAEYSAGLRKARYWDKYIIGLAFTSSLVNNLFDTIVVNVVTDVGFSLGLGLSKTTADITVFLKGPETTTNLIGTTTCPSSGSGI